jgi:hypothetical protein
MPFVHLFNTSCTTQIHPYLMCTPSPLRFSVLLVRPCHGSESDIAELLWHYIGFWSQLAFLSKLRVKSLFIVLAVLLITKLVTPGTVTV